MKPPPFEYARPNSLDSAIALLIRHDGDAKVIAGGQSLMPMLAFRLAAPKLLVDIARIPGLKAIEPNDDGVTLGALVRWCDIECSDYLAGAQPLMVEAIRHVAHYQIRNRGTVGGSLAHADPAAEMPAMALVCDATIMVMGAKGARNIAAEDYFIGPLITDLAADEVITGVSFPIWPSARRSAFEEFARRKGDFALAGVALFYDQDKDGAVVAPHIVGFGIADTPVRLKAAEDALAGKIVTPSVATDMARLAAAGIDINADIHAPADYRAALLGTLFERALRRAAGL